MTDPTIKAIPLEALPVDQTDVFPDIIAYLLDKFCDGDITIDLQEMTEFSEELHENRRFPAVQPISDPPALRLRMLGQEHNEEVMIAIPEDGPAYERVKAAMDADENL